MKLALIFLLGFSCVGRAGSIQDDLQAVIDQAEREKIKADPACGSQAGNSALVVIDMQPYFYKDRVKQPGSPGNVTKLKQIVQEEKKAIQHAKDAHIPIVFLEYESMYQGTTTKSDRQTNKEIMAALGDYKDFKVIQKNDDGMFSLGNSHRQELADYLKSKQIGTLVITGANGGACVWQSIKGALDNECNVVAYNKAIADFNFPDFMYPYAGHYNDIKPECTNCSFKEVFTMDEAAAAMINNSNRSQIATPLNTGTNR